LGTTETIEEGVSSKYLFGQGVPCEIFQVKRVCVCGGGGLFIKFVGSMGSSTEPTISHPTDMVQVSTFALGTQFH
jgi:hypothetical protein